MLNSITSDTNINNQNMSKKVFTLNNLNKIPLWPLTFAHDRQKNLPLDFLIKDIYNKFFIRFSACQL